MAKASGRLTRYLAEFLVVFLGVWLSLLAEQFREGRVDDRREVQALSAIASDLESERAWVDATILRAETGLVSARRFFDGLDEAALAAVLSDIGICSFTGNQRTSRYEALRTGELGYVQAGPLRAQIERLYFDSSTRDYLHARDCEASQRFFALVAPYAELTVPALEREDPIDGWAWNDTPEVLEVVDPAGLVTDRTLRAHVALLTSQRQFLKGWLEREVANREAVLRAIDDHVGG